MTVVTESQSPSSPITHIAPTRGWASLRLREAWEYRELLYFLIWRDVRIRYKQTALGVAWAVLQPLAMMLVLSLIGMLGKLPSNDIPYPVFTLAALLPWQLFAGALTRSSSSLVGNANLLTKIYFPRIIIPVSAVLAGVVDFLVALGVLAVVMACYHITPSWALLLLPVFTLLALAAALAVGLWLAALNVKYRDVQYIVPFLVQLWMFLSPVAYATELIPAGKWRLLFALNPMTGVIQGFRWALVGGPAPDAVTGLSAVIVLLLLIGGSIYFARTEKTFADIV